LVQAAKPTPTPNTAATVPPTTAERLKFLFISFIPFGSRYGDSGTGPARAVE